MVKDKNVFFFFKKKMYLGNALYYTITN